MSSDALTALVAQKNVQDAQDKTRKEGKKFEEESIRIRETGDKFYNSLALFSGGTIALSVTYLGYLRNTGNPILFHACLIASWLCLLVCAVTATFCPLLNSYFVHFGRLSLYVDALVGQNQTYIDEIENIRLANVSRTERQEHKARYIKTVEARNNDLTWAKKREKISSVLCSVFGWTARVTFPVGLGLLMFFAAENSSSTTVKATVPLASTATELFDLRSRCAELGQKIMQNNNIGSALTQDVVTRYDIPTNRCYAELDVHTADLTKFDDYNSRSLFDGQTREMLAHVEHKKGQKTGYVKGENVTDFDAAVLKMQEVMADDRK
jgi:hypothetical protein